MNIVFVVGNNDLDFYKFMDEHGALPDIITCRRFALHDAVDLKEHLMDLSTTEAAGAIYDSYLSNFTNTDGTINWLPLCGEVDGFVADFTYDYTCMEILQGLSIPEITSMEGRIWRSGYEAYSAMANTLRGHYGSDVLIAPANSFTGSVFKADYTEKMAGNMIMPNFWVNMASGSRRRKTAPRQ